MCRCGEPPSLLFCYCHCHCDGRSLSLMFLMTWKWRGIFRCFLLSFFTSPGAARLVPPFFHLKPSTSMVPKPQYLQGESEVKGDTCPEIGDTPEEKPRRQLSLLWAIFWRPSLKLMPSVGGTYLLLSHYGTWEVSECANRRIPVKKTLPWIYSRVF